MLVRPARSDEVGEIAALWSELVAYHQTIDPRLPKAAPDGEERYAYMLYELLLTGPRHMAFVAVNERGALVGYVFGMVTDLVPPVFMSERGGLLADIYVKPDYRRQGVGRKLYDAILEWFRSKDVTKVEWDAAVKNTDALAFWHAVGGQDMMIRIKLELRQDDDNETVSD